MATYVITTSPIGTSIPNYFFSLADELHRRGHTVIVITDKNKIHLLPINEDSKFFYSWPSWRPVQFRDFFFFYKLCRKHKPDCIIGNFAAQNIVMLTGKLLNIKYRVAYWHTVFEALKVDSKKRNAKNKFLHFRKKWLLKFLPTHIFTNSTANRDELAQAYKLNISQITILPLLIPDPLKGKALPQTRGNNVAFIGRLDKSKRQEILLRAVPALLKTFPDLQVHIAGTGSREEYLHHLCKELGIEAAVHFAGEVPLEEVNRILGLSKVHVSASVHEGFGLANVEALAMGTPVVAPAVGGIKEVLDDGKNGLFYDPAVENDIVEKIIAILQADWLTYSANARQSFLERFSDANISKQADIYEQLFQ
jgi:glycosyltransferase involved in cell wall biosynthesis